MSSSAPIARRLNSWAPQGMGPANETPNPEVASRAHTRVFSGEYGRMSQLSRCAALFDCYKNHENNGFDVRGVKAVGVRRPLALHMAAT